jgi:hypothetical protein
MPKSTMSKGYLPLFGDPIYYCFNLSQPYFRYANHWKNSKAREFVFVNSRRSPFEASEKPNGINNVHTDGSVKWYKFDGTDTESFLVIPGIQRRYYWGKQ